MNAIQRILEALNQQKAAPAQKAQPMRQAARPMKQQKKRMPYILPGGGTSQFNPNSVTNAGNLNPRTEDGYDVDVSHFNPGGEDGYDTTIAHLNGNMQNAPLPAFTLNRLGYGGTMNPGQQPRNGGYLGGGVPTFNGRIYEDAYAQKLYGPSGWINRY